MPVSSRCLGPGLLVAVMLAFGLLTSQASAQFRCDCNQIVDQCYATVDTTGNWATLRSNTPKCSRISWRTDEHPRTTVVTDGEEVLEILGNPPRSIGVNDCDVCRDNLLDRAASLAPNTASYFSRSPIYKDTPLYPVRALTMGIEGYVIVNLRVSPSGTVQHAQVQAAQPPGVFDKAALRAAQRFRFAPSSTGGETLYSFRFILQQ